MTDDRFHDEVIEGEEVVRSFMATGGRVRPQAAPELPLETLVSVSTLGRVKLDQLNFERHDIISELDGVSSIAEIAAHHGLPLRAAITVVSELVAEGLLTPAGVVDMVGLPMLHRIRDAIAAL